MSLEQKLVFYLPPAVFNVACIFGPVVLTLICFFIVRRLVPSGVLKKHHDIASAMLGIVGTVYGIFLAFVVATTWQYYNNTANNLSSEAVNLGELYSETKAFSPPFRDAVRKELREYRDNIVTKSFKSLARGEGSDEEADILEDLTTKYSTYQPGTPAEIAFYNESVHTLNVLKQLRQDRIDDSSSGLIPIVWFVLLAGAVVTIGFTFLFGSENIYVHTTMIALLSLVISLTLFTIVNVDFPFTGQVALAADPFTNLQMK